MKERPIIFSGPMVRAILDGRKTQTRRTIVPQPIDCNGVFAWASPRARMPGTGPVGMLTLRDLSERSPYGAPGDTLWVRETWGQWREGGPVIGSSPIYRADWVPCPDTPPRWRPSIHMPRWASRLTLLVKSVRVERLQEISEEDAIAEGVDVRQRSTFPGEERRACVNCGKHRHTHVGSGRCCFGGTGESYSTRTYRGGFAHLWEAINGKRAPWASNPWVWRVEFEEKK